MKITEYTREIALAIILVVTIIIHYLHIHGGVMYPSVHAICPLGGLENLWAWVGGQANLQKLFSGTMTLFFFTLVFALVFGRAFCGNICPFGALQELMGKIWIRKFKVPEKADKVWRLFKYPILVFITAMAWITATIWIAPYDPWAAFAHIWTGSELFAEMGIGAAVLVIVLVASIFVDRFFCKYLCPAGALYGIISKISFYKIKRENCQSCGQCTNVCPMNIGISKDSTVRSSECIACGQCIAACPPENDAIKMDVFGKTVKLRVFTLLVLALFFGSLVAFNATGMYQVTIPTFSEVQEGENHLKIVDLRGSMSIEVGALYAGMDLSDFYELMEIPETVPKETWLKNVVYSSLA